MHLYTDIWCGAYTDRLAMLYIAHMYTCPYWWNCNKGKGQCMLESGTLSLGDSRLKNAWGEFLQLCTIYGCVSHVYTNGTFLPVLLHYMAQDTARMFGGPIQQRCTVTGVIGHYQSVDHCPKNLILMEQYYEKDLKRMRTYQPSGHFLPMSFTTLHRTLVTHVKVVL